MTNLSPSIMIGIGFVLVVFGVAAPFLMVMRIIQPSFLLSFLSYAASVSGVLLGLVGSMMAIRRNRR